MTARTDEQWETVEDESPTRVIFDTMGDVFEGTFIGIVTVSPEDNDEWEEARFRGTDDGLYAISGYKVLNGCRKIKPGTFTRLTYVKDVKTNAAAPMKDIVVQTRK